MLFATETPRKVRKYTANNKMKTPFLICTILVVGIGLSAITSVQGDICDLPPKVGLCRGAFPRFYFDPKRGSCRMFIYGGCGGNANNFRRLKNCRKSCVQRLQGNICKLPPKVGLCRGRFPRYYFDPKRGGCRKFIYGGCGGNANNFRRMKNCWETCVQKDLCKLPPKVGLCRGAFPRFYFDPKRGHCRKFIYGGCGGNANNFRKMKNCRKTCM